MPKTNQSSTKRNESVATLIAARFGYEKSGARMNCKFVNAQLTSGQIVSAIADADFEAPRGALIMVAKTDKGYRAW